MDLPAIAETTVEMLVLIETKLIGRKRENIDPEVKAVMLDKAMSLYMTHIINEKKYSSTPPAQTPLDENHCQKCGRSFTERELGFLEGKTGDERICYHCSKGIN